MSQLLIYHITQTSSPEVGAGMKKFATARNLSDPIKDKVSRIASSILDILKANHTP